MVWQCTYDNKIAAFSTALQGIPSGEGSQRKLCPPMDNVPQPPNRVNTTLRLHKLRTEMKRMNVIQMAPIDAYIITTDDDHQVLSTFINLTRDVYPLADRRYLKVPHSFSLYCSSSISCRALRAQWYFPVPLFYYENLFHYIWQHWMFVIVFIRQCAHGVLYFAEVSCFYYVLVHYLVLLTDVYKRQLSDNTHN